MKRSRRLLRSEISVYRLLLLVFYVFVCSIPGSCSSRVVTLGSIQIFSTHEWLSPKPTVYFHCQGEKIQILPDVKETHFFYTFKGEESWQPVTEIPDKKCKRCGLYEKDSLKPDDVFDEWELCADDFVDGKYSHFKDKEFNATFLCPQCTVFSGSAQTSTTNAGVMVIVLVIIIGSLVSIIAIIGTVSVYRYWKKRKREQDQARFLKLFEEGDDIEDELGLAHEIY